ncbi:hypothetical protein PAMP_003075 [Pampus punctatissimus]
MAQFVGVRGAEEREWGPCELCQCFNIDVKHPRIFSGPEDALFGFSVLQHEADGEKSMLVGAPWDGPPNNRKGDVYKCVVGEERNSNCNKVNLGETALQNISKNLRNSHLGMTLTPDSPDGFLACAPLWSQECGTSMFSTGICASVSDDLEPREMIAPTAQISTPGTRSRTSSATSSASSTSAQTRCSTEAFSAERGAREGATKVMIVVTDGESHDGEELPDALEECETRNITRYAIAVSISLQVNPTDPPAPLNRQKCGEWCYGLCVRGADRLWWQGWLQTPPFATRETDSTGTTVKVLGHYIRRQQDPETFIKEIKYIASDPEEKFFFNVTDEAALNDIVDALGDRIFTLEGTLGYNESSFHMEMSQIGFSTHTLDDGILFGMVGAYDWDGGVLKEGTNGRIIPPREAFESEFPLELKNHAAYLGYTVSSVVVGDWRKLYVAGAPRFKHKGKIILFELSNNGDVNIVQALNGEQIGSYYGSEVCGLDIDQDGITDVLLVAAPMYLGSGNKEAGRVYIYTVSGEEVFVSNGTLKSEEKSQDARFGYALAAAPDLNHDGFTDLLVGAPLEDEHRGAIYVYHGDSIYINHNYKQRISGSSISPSLQYFGRSLSARLDLDGDELIDLAVGAQGSAVLLSSRSIVQINVSLSFQPHSINVIQKTCQRGNRESACLNATACFTAVSRSPGPHSNSFELWVSAMLDDRKLSARALFDDSSHRQTQLAVRVHIGQTLCYKLPFHVYDTADYIRPISFSLRFKINNTESGPVLDEGWPTTVKKYISFFKDCGEDDVCTTDLVLQAHMDISGTRQKPYVIRSHRRRLAVEVQLQNRLENAYNTSLTLHYSRNLHFSSLSIKEGTHFKIECTALGTNSHSCNVSYPVFRSQSKVNFMLEFEFSCTSLHSRVQMKLTAASDSVEREETLGDNSVQLQSFVQYEPDLFVSSDSNLNRYEVHPTRTVSEAIGPEFYTHLRLQNLGCYSVSNLELRLNLPSVAAGDRVFMTVTDVFSYNATGVNCSVLSDLAQLKDRQRDVHPLHPEDMMQNDILNCSGSWCTEVVCEVQQLLKGQAAIIRVSRRVHDDFFRKAKYKSARIIGAYHLAAQETNLITLGTGTVWRETVLEVLKGRAIPISLWILIGSIIGGLLLLALIIFILWKLGFFARKHRGEDENHED